MTRGRLPSVPELDDRLRKLEERDTDPQGRRYLTTTPPAVQWMQRKAAKMAIRVLLALLLGAATAVGGWAAKDCQQSAARAPH